MAMLVEAANVFVEVLRLIEDGDKLSFFLVVCLLVLVARYLFELNMGCCERRLLPPGPRGLPFVGFLPFLRPQNTYLQLAEMAKEYGPVYQMKLGVKNYLVLADYEGIREALRKEEFSGRPVTPFTDFFNGCGVVNTQGESWKNQRKFAQEMLRNFGVHMSQHRSRKHLDDILTTEINSLLVNLHHENGKEVDLHCHLAACTANVISYLLMSVRFESTDSKFRRLLFLMDEGFRLFSLIAPVNFIPALQFVPVVKSAHKTLMRHREEMFSFFREVIENHKTTWDPSLKRDFIDLYLNKINEGPKNKFNEAQLYQVLADLITSGMETSRVTLQWFLLFVAGNPDVKEKIQREIDDVIGGDRLPNIDDMGSLPYTEAAIWETQRLANVITVAPPHSTTKDTTLGDYFIPRDTIVLPLLWCVHKDETTWKNPDKFDPTRFLTDDGSLKRPERFIPFGIGRRHCLGSVLARLELFLIATNILHQFDVTLPSNVDIDKIESIATTTRSPVAQKLIITSRNTSNLC